MTAPINDDDRSIRDSRMASGPGAGKPAAASDGESSSSDRLAVGMRLAEFEITGYVGDGGFSIVYLAWDHSLERQVALKEYMPSSLASRNGGTRVFPRSERHRETFEAGLKSFVNEGKLLAQFDHPSLVKVYRFWEEHGTAYMVMPFYKGVTLKETVRAMAQPPDEAWLRSMLEPLTAALSVIHRAQCFHRDIAPDNVLLLAGSGKPLLLDFGAARRVIGDKTQALTVILKPGYAPVEQYAEDPTMRQGAWTDVYALAAVIYWAVTGKTPPTSVSRALNDSYVPLTQSAAGRYSERFLAAVDRALIVLPERRTPSIERLRDELGLGVALPDAHPDTPPPLDLDVTVIRPKPAPSAPSRWVQPPAPAPVPAGKDTSTASPVDAPTAPSPQDTARARSGMRPWLPLAGVAALAVGTGLWWISRPDTPPAKPTVSAPPPSTAPAPAPTSLPPDSAPAPPTAPPPPANARAVLAQIDAERDASIELKATLVAERNGTTRLQFQASEGGYAYVMGSRQDSNELVMLYPPRSQLGAKLGVSGKLDVPLPAKAGVPAYYLLWARESRNLAESGWFIRDPGWVRRFDAGVAPVAAATVLGAPQCAARAKRCDAAYAMTEVIDMTNVTTPAPAPGQTPSTDTNTPAPARGQPAGPGSETPPSSEEKPRARRNTELSAQCRELLNRASLGDTSAELIEKLKTLRCGN